jgi:hypothetical protein
MPEKTDAEIYNEHHTGDGKTFAEKDQCQCVACKRYRAPKPASTEPTQ